MGEAPRALTPSPSGSDFPPGQGGLSVTPQHSDFAFWHKLSNHHPDPDPQWERVRRRTPRPAWANT
eukprot:scaffold21288_cov30-Tisochrysis_lutea.AAC.1